MQPAPIYHPAYRPFGHGHHVYRLSCRLSSLAICRLDNGPGPGHCNGRDPCRHCTLSW